MPRVRFRAPFSGGWWPQGPIEEMPPKTLRRSRGIHPIKTHVLRSRWGSTLVTPNLTAHSLYRFINARFAGVDTRFFRNGVLIQSGLNGNRLHFARMPAQQGDVDSLFVAGGGLLFKVDFTGAVSNWGIAAPPDGFTAVDGGAGAMAAGTYKYQVTFRNSVTGSRSNGNPTPVSITQGASKQVNLASLPVSTDAQVNAREIWRTQANGTFLFLLTTINNNTATTYTDNAIDSALGVTAIQLDNAKPDPNYNVAVGPHQGRMFWADIGIDGRRGQIAYSPSGRPESDASFIQPSNDDDPVKMIVSWNGSLWAFTPRRLIQVIGTDEPFTFQDVIGAPGTNNPESVKVSPYGIVYQGGASGDNGALYLFDGASAPRPVVDPAIGLMFRGEALPTETPGVQVGPLSGVTSTYGRVEYFLSDGTNGIAVNAADATARDLGIGFSAIYYEPDTGKLLASFGGNIVTFEDTNALTDSGASIPFEIQTPGGFSDVATVGLIQRVYIEIDTVNQFLTPYLNVDGADTALPMLSTAGRTTIEYPINKTGRVVSVRLSGSATKQIQVYGIELDIWVPVPTLLPASVAGSKEPVFLPWAPQVPST